MDDNILKVQQKKEVEHNGETTKTEKYFVPAVDIYENDKEVTVIAEMPGVNSKGVELSLEDDILTITGNMEKEKQEEAKILLQEYESGHYMRRFTITEAINQEKIQAAMLNGLLRITLPKAPPAQPKRIEVAVG